MFNRDDLQVEFRERKEGYSSSVGLYVGKLCAVSYSYDGCRPSGDNRSYKVFTSLPFFSNKPLGSYETTEECEKRCYEVLDSFLKRLTWKDKQ